MPADQPTAGADRALPSRRSEWAANWTTVLVGVAGMVLGTTSHYTLGVFIAPLQAEFGWSRTEITSVTTINALGAILLGSLLGALVDKVGPRRVGLPGSVLYCGAFALLALTTASIWSWWLLWGLLLLVGQLISPVIWTSAVAGSFDRSRGLALAVTLSGSGVTLIVMPTLATLMVDYLGWRAGFAGLSVILAVTVIPLAYVFLRGGAGVRDPVRTLEGAAAGVTARQAVRTIRFAKLTLAAFLFFVGTFSFTINLVPVLSSIGVSRASAAGMGAVIGLASMTGRISTGFLLDRFNANLIGAFTVLAPILGCLCFVLAPGSIPAAMVGTFVTGLALGAEYDVVAYLIGRHFGVRSYGTLFGTVNAAIGIASAVGPMMYSRVFDTTGSYLPALWTSIPLYLVGALFVATLGSYRVAEGE